MFRKILVAIVGLFSLCFCQTSTNWNGYQDTAEIKGLYKDTTIYTGWFNMSSFENCVYDVYCTDSTSAGVASDSCAFEWGIQTAHISWLTTSMLSKKYSYSPRYLIDTVNTTVAGNFVQPDLSVIPVDGGFSFITQKGKLDSLKNSGWSSQTRQFSAPWDVYFRFYAHAITGMKNTKKCKVVFQAIRRLGMRTN